MPNHEPDKAAAALKAMEDSARASPNVQDLSYFNTHRNRYLRTLSRICALQPPGARVLDVGSHLLHLTGALSLLGFQTYGMDVPVFSQNENMRSRADRYGIRNFPVDTFQDGAFLAGMEESFDLIVFTEIMEHITFNPVLFWRRIHQLLKVGGAIYITTPNALTPWKILATIKNAVTLRGTGLPVHRIFDTITYGHHWKEYTGREIRRYFRMLSADFDVTVRYFSLEPEPVAAPAMSPKTLARRLVNSSAGIVPAFSEQIEAVVRLPRKTDWTLGPPAFG
jgi:2-polyprenyl-6-hydroxyphenyl methylase/3-demethylubiquinone-9 3-methyltransferase